MIKIFLKLIITTFIFITTSCSYKPIFSEKNYNFQIDEIILSGHKDINRVIEKKLSMIAKSQKSGKKNFSVIVNSIKNKKIISNDSKGDALKFDIYIIVAYKIAEKSMLSTMGIKESINRSFEIGMSEGILFERRIFNALFSTEDKKEGMSAFIEKRTPKFEDK